MTDPDIERAAEFLAARAVLLMALGIAAALAALLAVAGLVQAIRRYQPALRRGFTAVLDHVPRIDAVERSVRRTSTTLRNGYVVAHLVLGLALSAAVAVFAVIAEDVFSNGEIAAFDVAFARELREAASPGAERAFSAVSALGTREPIAVAALAIAAYLARYGRLVALWWIAAQAGGGMLNLALKDAFERTRPEYADPLLAASSWSFPSGHAMGTFILCGLGCYVLLRQTRSWMAGGIVIGLSLAWCVVMAFSRLYLGVHFASDVIAGVIAGVAWVTVCASAFEVIRRRTTPA